MASRSRQPLPLLALLACLALVLRAGQRLCSISFIVPWKQVRSPDVALRARAERDLDGRTKQKEYKVNEEIRANEVRVIGIVSDKLETGGTGMEETNEIMAFSDALDIARNKGVDLILINEEADPPLVKIARVGKYVYEEKKQAKEQAKNKAPKMKEVKITYTIGDHDLNTKLRNVEKWVENKRQQVKVHCVMKGRTRMFEGQARELMERIRREVAHFAKVPGVDKGNPPITKDGRGDLIMLLGAGADKTILKQLVEEAGGKQALKKAAMAAAEDEEDEEDEEEEEGEESSDEIKAIEAEIQEMKEDLIDCGINPGQVMQEPEMQDLMKRLSAAKSKLTAAALPSAPARRQRAAFTASADALMTSQQLRRR